MRDIHTLDARGCPCPQPLIKTRRLWKTLSAGQPFQVLVDNDIAHINLMSFLEAQGASPQTSHEGEDWVILATRSGEAQVSTPVQAEPEKKMSVPVPEKKTTHSNYIVVLKSDRMGQGDDDLGRILVKGYLNTLRELDKKPSSVILYNSGAQLAAKDSGAETALQALEKENVDVIVCGACVDFFNMKDRLVTGRISNMYEIAEKIAETGHVVYP